jgi:hypothetical protein
MRALADTSPKHRQWPPLTATGLSYSFKKNAVFAYGAMMLFDLMSPVGRDQDHGHGREL